MSTTRSCLNCSNPFEPPAREIKRGNGKFCSLKCSAVYRGKTRSAALLPNTVCDFCSTNFYRSESKRKTKSGLVFCSRSCKDSAQNMNNERFSNMWPSHYKIDGSSDYRRIALRSKELKCERCGYDEHGEIIQVHHMDHDRNNNSIDNLELLCPNCHAIEHFVIHRAQKNPP